MPGAARCSLWEGPGRGQEHAAGDAAAQVFSIAWTTAGDEQLIVDGLRILVRQLPGAPICLDAEGGPIIGRVTAAAQIGGVTVRIEGVSHALLPGGATVRPRYCLRRATMASCARPWPPTRETRPS